MTDEPRDEPLDSKTSPEAGGSCLSQLRELTTKIKSYTQAFHAEAVSCARRAGDEEASDLIDTTADALELQMLRICDLTVKKVERLSPIQERELSHLLEAQVGDRLLDRGLTTMTRGLRERWGRNFLLWLGEFFQEIKKILRFILKLIFKLFGAALPGWIDELFELLDQIKNMILSLLGMILGLDRDELSRQLSAKEVQFLDELAAVERLQIAYGSPGSGKQD